MSAHVVGEHPHVAVAARRPQRAHLTAEERVRDGDLQDGGRPRRRDHARRVGAAAAAQGLADFERPRGCEAGDDVRQARVDGRDAHGSRERPRVTGHGHGTTVGRLPQPEPAVGQALIDLRARVARR